MHLSSLSSPYGIGSMGKPARDFIDFLKAAGQGYWQLLPICPTSYGDSPYQSFSTYAGNPYFIDLELLEADGPAAYFSTLPVTKMVQNVKAHDLPCEISYSAGTYVCNSIMYRVLHLAAKEYPEMKAGFIHVPYSCEQAAKKNGYVASMPLETIAKSLEYAIAAAIS